MTTSNVADPRIDEDGGRPGLDEVDITIERGRFTAVTGSPGSRKSTLMHCLAGLDTLTSGQVLLAELDLRTSSDLQLTTVRRNRIGFVFQTFNLVPTLTAIESVTLPADPTPERVLERMKRLGEAA